MDLGDRSCRCPEECRCFSDERPVWSSVVPPRTSVVFDVEEHSPCENLLVNNNIPSCDDAGFIFPPQCYSGPRGQPVHALVSMLILITQLSGALPNSTFCLSKQPSPYRCSVSAVFIWSEPCKYKSCCCPFCRTHQVVMLNAVHVANTV